MREILNLKLLRGVLSHYGGIKRVFIIGAGFSYPAGLPLTNQLLSLIHHRARLMKYGEHRWGQAQRLMNELKYYYPLDKFTHKKISDGNFNDKIDIEEFLSYVHSESNCLHPSDMLTEHGSYFVSFCKRWLGEIIYSKQNEIFKSMPDYFNDFVLNIQNSIILCFNWDTLLEHQFDRNDIKYRYQFHSDNYEQRLESIPLIKLHGSIDWFTNNRNAIDSKSLRLEALGSEFVSISRGVGNLQEYYNSMKYPWIVIPTFDKLGQIRVYGQIWETPTRYLDDDLEVIVIGYSMRPDDYHARSFIYPKIVNETRRGTMSVKVVDYAQTESKRSEIRNRFKGVKNCKFWFNGFNKESLDFIFD